MAIRLTYDFVKKEFYKEGYKLISKEYKNCMLKLETICPNGHEYLVSWNTFQQGHRCKECHIQSNSEKFKYSYEFVKEQFEKEGYKLLSKEYKNNKIKLETICPNGHEYSVRYDNFEQGQRCKKCANIKLSKEKVFNYEYIKNEFEKEGYELITKEYINANIKLETICPNGHEYSVRYSNFKDGIRCKICHVLNNTGENCYFWKGGVTEKNIPLYDTYAHQIDFAEEVRRDIEDENILQVKCSFCNEWYTPKMTDVVRRINALEGKQTGELRFYCSPECKQSFSIFGKQEKTYLRENSPYYEEQNNYRPYQTEWSKMVIEKDNYTCQICEATEDLVAHHIKPVKTHPHLQADVDNGICLCEKCHNKHGHKDECSTGNLAKKVC